MDNENNALPYQQRITSGSVSVELHVKKSNQSCAIKFENLMYTEIAKIEKWEYRTIIQYLYMKRSRGKWIYKDIFGTMVKNVRRMRPLKNWIASLKRAIGKAAFCVHSRKYRRSSQHDFIRLSVEFILRLIALLR